MNSVEFSFQLITDTDDALTSKIVGISVSFLKDNGYYFAFNNSIKAAVRSLFEDVFLKKPY